MISTVHAANIVLEEEVEPRIYNADDGIITMMDCGGSNVEKIDEQIPGIVRMIATSRIKHKKVRARKRAKDLDVPLVEVDFRAYEGDRGIYPGDVGLALDSDKWAYIRSNLRPEKILQVRKDVSMKLLEKMYACMDEEGIPKNVPVFAAGFMSLLPREFIDAFTICNVHPGLLTIHKLVKRYMRGDRALTGDGWVPPAEGLSMGLDNLYSSFHALVTKMDDGPMFMRGYALPIDGNYIESLVDLRNPSVVEKLGGAAQDALKHLGDHVIAGATFMDLFDGKWGVHKESGMFAYNFRGMWHLVPRGITIEDHVANYNGKTPFARDSDFLAEKTREFYKAVEELAQASK